MSASRAAPHALSSQDRRAGLLSGIGAYLIWGMMPIFFKLLPGVSPLEVVAHRIAWSVLFLIILLAAMRLYPVMTATLGQPRIVGALTISALLIIINWLVYVWAIGAQHVVAASLGYFLTPLANVLIGVIFLKERLRRGQTIAILIAVIGVAVLGSGELQTLWISFTLALSFAFYGLVRKLVVVPAPVGLAVETLVLTPPALIVLGWFGAHGTLAFGRSIPETLLLVSLGAVTSVPLILFANAARRLPMISLGLMQYITPMLQFLSGVFLFGEKLSPERWACFGLIWTALALFVWDSLRGARR